MDIETCLNYLNFVSKECERHLEDGHISDDELNQFIVEFERFQNKCKESNLPLSIKTKVNQIKLDYRLDREVRIDDSLIIAFLTLGIWGCIISYRNQIKRKQTLNDIRGYSSGLITDIKINH